jgi:hypothetical protein
VASQPAAQGSKTNDPSFQAEWDGFWISGGNVLAKIAILGWGSLLWDKRPKFTLFLSQCGPWLRDGPSLPLEFSRISKSRGGALTLVVDPENGTETVVSYCVSARTRSSDAIEDLRVREGPTRKEWIGSFRPPHEQSRYFSAIQAWASNHGFDDVVWADLPPDFLGKPFSVKAAIAYVEGLDIYGATMARQYLKQAPDFVRTPVRHGLRRFVEQNGYSR